MGLGPLTALYHARFNRYLQNRQLDDTSNSRVWAFLGDGECDEPETLGSISLAAREQLDNLTFVVNCNLQRLDGPVQAHAGHSFHFWDDARRSRELREPARDALKRVGLADRGDVLVSNMSHGEHRQIELAMALATKPRMLLLDEPMAGLGPDESSRMVRTLRELKRELTILLIEHDMEAVFALADRITVLVYGRVIASGSPSAIRTNAEVRQAYLGEQEVVTDAGAAHV